MPVFPEQSKKSSDLGNQELDLKIGFILSEFEKILLKQSWKTIKGKNELQAYRFSEGYDELWIKLQIEPVEKFHLLKILLIRNKESIIKEFKVSEEIFADKDKFQNLILPFLAAKSFPEKGSQNNSKYYFTTASIGYNRTHDNHRFYPEYGQGSFYMSGNLLYDPSVNVKSKKIDLVPGDYLWVDLFYAYDSHMRENYFNIDLLLYGKNEYRIDGNKKTRILYGLFNGFEYFRPGYYNSALKWNRQIYKKQPHIQYTIWRALQYSYILTNTYGSSTHTMRLMASVGTSINSSLIAADVNEEEEKELSHIFKSIKYRKQNYYYGISLPLSAEYLIDKFYSFKFSAGHNFYLFYPVENERAYDMLNLSKFSIGYYITDHCLFETHYEYWSIQGMVRTKKNAHSWNRLVMELRFLF